MAMWHRLVSWLAWFPWYRRRAREADLERELRNHLELETEENKGAGMSPEQAAYAAQRALGSTLRIEEDVRAAWGLLWLQTIAQDVRYGFRMLRKSPGFTAVAVVTLALGVGANTAIFSIVDAVLLQRFAYPDPNQLVVMFNVPLSQPDALSGIPYRDFTEYRGHNRVFSEMAGNTFHDLTLTGAGEPTIVNTADVTPEIFRLLGAKPLAGRTLLAADGKQGAAPVAVVSEDLWRSRFSSDPGLIGKPITLDMRPFTVVGILPASFHYPDGAPRQDVWISVAQDPLFGPLLSRPSARLLGGLGRLKPGVSLLQAQTEMNTLAARLARDFPAEDSGLTIHIEPYRKFVVGNVKSPVLILLGLVGLVLLIACANIANLLLSRATFRQREIAVRMALGAGHARIVRQLLTESVLLGLLGGVAGVLLAACAIRGFRPFLPTEVTQINSIHLGGPVLGFTLLLSLVAALVFGLAPSLLATFSNLQMKVQENSDRAGQRGGRRLRSVLAIAEVSMAMVLLIAGGLLTRSFALVSSVNPGFDPKNVIEAEVSLPQFQYRTPQQWTAFANELLVRLHAQPGLQESALAAPLPMDRQGEAALPFIIADALPLPPSKSQTADYETVSPDYFRVMRIPLLRGRLFTDQDDPSNSKVAIISETLVRRYFPNQDPLGRKMKFGFPPNNNTSREIVGIVGDVRDVALSRNPGPVMYVPFAQAPLYGGEVVVRSSLSASSVAAAMRQVVRTIDKNLPVTDIEPLRDALGKSISQERFRTLLLGSFSAIALALAGVGIFGVVSYSTSQRTHEIGIRMALGAERRDVLRLVLGQGARLALWGLGIGALAAFLLTRLMSSLLYRVSAQDPVTFASVTIILLAVALAACYIPARRATRVHPMVALRHE